MVCEAVGEDGGFRAGVEGRRCLVGEDFVGEGYMKVFVAIGDLGDSSVMNSRVWTVRSSKTPDQILASFLDIEQQ